MSFRSPRDKQRKYSFGRGTRLIRGSTLNRERSNPRSLCRPFQYAWKAAGPKGRTAYILIVLDRLAP
jgi:hypothetical protein